MSIKTFWGSPTANGTPRQLRSGIPEWNGRQWVIHPLIRECDNGYVRLWWHGWLIGAFCGVAATVATGALGWWLGQIGL